MADAIPIDEYQRWYGPRQAINHLKPVASSTVIDALRAGIRSGAIKAAAHLVIETLPGQPPKQVGSYERLEPGAWIDQAQQRFWDFGSITIEPPTVPGRGLMETFSARGPGPDQELTGVRLDPTAIDNLLAQLLPTLDYSGANAMVKATATARQRASEQKPKGQKRRGPKRKPFWGPAIAFAEASISNGELQPESLADVEKAMTDWLAKQGHYPGESTLRGYAKKVWDPIDPQGQ